MIGSLTTPRPTSSRSLAATLERDRLEHRVRRAAVAIAALRRRAGGRPRELGAPPKQIQQAIVHFEAQIAEMTARLQELSRDGASTGSARPTL